MKELISCLFRRKRLALIFFLAMVAGPMTLAYVLPQKYEAAATLLLEPGRFKKPFLPSERDSRTSLVEVSMEDVGSEVEILLSRPVLSVVVDKNHLDTNEPPEIRELGKWLGYWTIEGIQRFLVFVGLQPGVPPREDAITRLARRVKVEYVKRTNIITVSWRGSTPELARDVVNTLVDAYLQHHVRVHGNRSALDAVEAEMSRSQQELLALEGKLKSYEARRKIGDAEAEHRDLVAKLTETANRYSLLQAVGEKGLTTSELSQLDGDPAFSGLWARLNDMELKRVDLLSHYGPTERRVATLDEQIDRLKSLIRERYERNLAAAKDQVEAYRRQLTDLETSKLEIERQRRQLEGVKQLYSLNREKYNEVQISTAMDLASVGSVSVVEYADLSTAPAFPKRLLILVVSVLLGLVGGVGVALGFDRMSNRVVSVSDIESIPGLCVLASVKEYPPKKTRDRTGGLGGAEYDLLPVREALRNGCPGPCSVLVVSPSHAVGTTFLVEHLARVAAGGDRTRLLVSFRPAGEDGPEAPARTPSRLLEASSLRALATDEGLFSRLVVEVPGDASPSSGAEVEALIGRLKNEGYAILLFETPTYRGETFYLQIVAHVDHVVLVAGYDLTNRHSLARMADLVRRQNGHLTGCILNRRQDVIPNWIYERIF